jgi:2,4-dienoyl-CoA reductase-like NADH-dependent reductase (Old Yellow Enzyme family)
MRNRLVLAPLTNLQSHEDGTLGEDEYRWLERRAHGGYGLMMTCASYVQANGKGYSGQLGSWSDTHLAGLERLARMMRSGGSLAALQIQHSGARARPQLSGLPAVGPWDDPETGVRALTTAEVEQVIEDFVRAALRAETAGFDGVQLHAAHGYLLGQFLVAERNQRADRYGGTLENRSRILFEIIDGIRQRAHAGFQIGLRLSPERFGIRIDEALAVARRAMTSGQLDFLDMSLWDAFKEPQDESHWGQPLIDWFGQLDRGPARFGVAGKIMGSARAQSCIDHGADYVLIGRGAVLHPDFPLRALADPGFTAVKRPVTRAYLREQGLGPAFIEYLATSWPHFVAD